ncbi:hypothetical protein [Streptomyces sp. WAC05858]|uniref:hypothetical protein n=1 Tax=Streptomyces TaxID=1883 RepID=UPI000F7B1967|nr:hypothetical protein [Streptomyces sp. WAC05858]RSS35529.1 hypothetical protein EF902_37685 [Streptomyces sp. WAC05858]
MADTRDLWWAAGRLAFPVSTGEWMTLKWHRALRRAATLLEPVWPTEYSGGPFTHALPTVALVLYAGDFDSEPDEVPVEQLVAALTPNPEGEPQIEDTVREALTGRGHDLEDDSPLSALFRQLTEYRPPLAYSAGGLELPSLEQWPGGTLMREAARWSTYWLDYHHLSASSA